MEKRCELCNLPARMYCESDEALLCWDCDEKIHSANFLVAKHSRSLLCNICQSPTPWNASGRSLSPTTISVCDTCVRNNAAKSSEMTDLVHRDVGNSSGNESYRDTVDNGESFTDSDTEDEEEEEDDDDEEEEDGENQVVPWSSFPSPPSSTDKEDQGEEETLFIVSSAAGGSSLKRPRYDAYVGSTLDSEDEICCSSTTTSGFNLDVGPATFMTTLPSSEEEDDEATSLRPLKVHRTNIQSPSRMTEGESGTPAASAIINSIINFQQSMNTGDAISAICKLTRLPS